MAVFRSKVALRLLGLAALALLLCAPTAAVWCRDASGHSAVENALAACCTPHPELFPEGGEGGSSPDCGEGCEDLSLNLTARRGERATLPPLADAAEPSGAPMPPGPDGFASRTAPRLAALPPPLPAASRTAPLRM